MVEVKALAKIQGMAGLKEAAEARDNAETN